MASPEGARAKKNKLEDRAKVFTIGAAYGFVAGVFATALLVWQYGDVVTRRPPASQARPNTIGQAGVDDKADTDAPIIQPPAPAPTSGASNAAGPTLNAPASEGLAGRRLEL